METKNNSHGIQRAFIDAVANMLEVMPGDILIMRPMPKQNFIM
jgi:hypothetical protein